MTATLPDVETRQLPQDVAAEQSVLGGMMLSRTAIAEVLEILDVEDLYRPAHQSIFDCILELYGRGDPVDAVAVSAELERRQELLRVGGAPYLHTLIATVPTAANASYYAEIVVDRAFERRLIEAGTRIVQIGFAGVAEPVELIDEARAALDTAVDRRAIGGDGPLLAADAAEQFLEHLNAPKQPPLPTGLHDLDSVLGGGLRPKAVYTVAARPGVGKSTIGANFAATAAKAGTGVLVASLEMDRHDIMACWFAAEKRIERSHLVDPSLMDDRDRQLVVEAHDVISQWPLYVWDEPYISVASLRTRAREIQRSPHGLGLIVVDYLQLMQPSDPKAQREAQVAALSRGIKLLAKEFSVPVVSLAQLNRNLETRPNRKPALADLRESGAIEADSDGVLLLWEDEESEGALQVLVAKNRHGRTGDVALAYAKHYASVRNLACEE